MDYAASHRKDQQEELSVDSIVYYLDSLKINKDDALIN